jgi:hypothetical protein
MELTKIRAVRDARPFQAFMLVLDDGRRFVVEKPYYRGISSKQDLILVSSAMGTPWFGPERVKDAIPPGTIAA